MCRQRPFVRADKDLLSTRTKGFCSDEQKYSEFLDEYYMDIMKKYIGLIVCIILLNSAVFSQTITDNDGNSYKTIVIGKQIWIAENLKTTKYNDGTIIPDVIDSTVWHKLTSGAQCTYNNTTNFDFINTNGRLYNWYAVNTGKLCPTGWHVPSNNDWDTLITYLAKNKYSLDSSNKDIAKSLASSSGWLTDDVPNNIGNDQSKNNSTKFSAVPSGCITSIGGFISFGKVAHWWSSTTETRTGEAYFLHMHSNSSKMDRHFCHASYGFSVRCVKDE